MKRKILLAYLVLLEISCLCQSTVGVSGGLTMPFFYDRNNNPPYHNTEFGPSVSYNLSINYLEQRGRLFNFAAELFYNQRKVQMDMLEVNKSSWLSKSILLNFETINISLMATISNQNRFKVIFGIGPYFGYIVNSNKNEMSSSYIAGTGYDQWTENGSAKEIINGSDIGIRSILQIQIPVSKRLFFNIHSSFNFPLSSIGELQFSAVNSRNYTLSFGASYYLETFSFFRKLVPKVSSFN